MVERIANEPWSIWGGFLVWLPLGFWIVSLVHMMVQAEIDAIVGTLGILLAIILGVLTFSPPHPSLSPILIAAVFLLVLSFPAIRSAMNKRAMNAIDADLVERAYATLREKPLSIGSEIRIATILYERGFAAHAIGILERVLANVPKQGFEAEHRLLKNWQSRTEPAHLRQSVVCAQCGYSNAPGPVWCTRCGSAYLLDSLRGRVVASGAAGKLLLSWLIAIAATVMLAWAAIALPPVVAAGVIGVTIPVAGVAIWAVFRRQTA